MNLLDYLPAIYQDPTDGANPVHGREFLRQFLQPFEHMLLSAPDRTPDIAARGWMGAGIQPLADKIARVHLLFDPETTPEAFLYWLAGWVALTLRSDLSETRQRRLLANAARLYPIRGTRRYLDEILKLYVEALPSVTDGDQPQLQIAVHSTVGTDTYLGGGPSFLFHVTLAFSQKDNDFVAKQSQLARDVIELERPAHTWYRLRVIFPKLQLGVHSTVGVDTVLAPSMETHHD
jgi:phage tail-like protein